MNDLVLLASTSSGGLDGISNLIQIMFVVFFAGMPAIYALVMIGYGIKRILNSSNESDVHRIKGGMIKASLMFGFIYVFIGAMYWIMDITGVDEAGANGANRLIEEFNSYSNKLNDTDNIGSFGVTDKNNGNDTGFDIDENNFLND